MARRPFILIFGGEEKKPPSYRAQSLKYRKYSIYPLRIIRIKNSDSCEIDILNRATARDCLIIRKREFPGNVPYGPYQRTAFMKSERKRLLEPEEEPESKIQATTSKKKRAGKKRVPSLKSKLLADLRTKKKHLRQKAKTNKAELRQVEKDIKSLICRTKKTVFVG